MPPRAAVPDALRADVFLARTAVAAGLLTRRQLDGDTWRAVLRGVYVHRDQPVTHELRTRAAMLLVPAAVVTGRSPLPLPVAQYSVRDGDRFVARVDFAWPEAKVAVEYDGLWHAEPGQFARDRQRLDRLQAAGWRVVFVTAADLGDPGALIARIASALGSCDAGVHESTRWRA